MKLLAAVAGVSLLALTIAGDLPAKGPKAQCAMCTIKGPVCSEQGIDYPLVYPLGPPSWSVEDCDYPVDVEIGVNVTGWWPPDGNLALQVSGEVLAGLTDGTNLPGGTYFGRARLLDHSFRFQFDTEPDSCKFITSPVNTPLGDDLPEEYCTYDLSFWNKDEETGAFTWYTFFDYSTLEGTPSGCDDPELVDPPSFCRARGPLAELGLPDQSVSCGDTELCPAAEEPAQENCKNKKDDDGDGLVDCQDPDCIGGKFCP